MTDIVRPRGVWQSTKLVTATVADTAIEVTVKGGSMVSNGFGAGANLMQAAEIVSRNAIRAADFSEEIFEIELDALRISRLKELQEQHPELDRWKTAKK